VAGGDGGSQHSSSAHGVCGDDFIAVLPHCEDRLREILDRSFQFLWSISPGDWHLSTPDQNSLSFLQ